MLHLCQLLAENFIRLTLRSEDIGVTTDNDLKLYLGLGFEVVTDSKTALL